MPASTETNIHGAVAHERRETISNRQKHKCICFTFGCNLWVGAAIYIYIFLKSAVQIKFKTKQIKQIY